MATNLFDQIGQDVRLQHYIIDESYARAKTLLQTAVDTRKPLLVIAERSLLSNVPVFIEKLSDDARIKPVDFALLKEKSIQLHNFLLTDFRLKPLYVFLHDNAENLMTRLKRRNRKGEEGVTEQYLDDLNQRYFKFYDSLAFPCRVFDLTKYQIDSNSLNLDLTSLSNDIWEVVKNAR